jgi:hypothetical protein
MRWLRRIARFLREEEPDQAATATLLVDQARAFVQIEESRFAAAQARATTLLAVAGVLAGIGAGVLSGLSGREYASTAIGGNEIPFVYWSVRLLGGLAIGTLLWSAATALGALKKEPESRRKAEELDNYLNEEALLMLRESPAQAADSLLTLLGGQREHVHASTAKVDEGFKSAARFLGFAVASGLTMVLLVVIGTTSKPQEVHLIERTSERSMAGSDRDTLRKP